MPAAVAALRTCAARSPRPRRARRRSSAGDESERCALLLRRVAGPRRARVALFDGSLMRRRPDTSRRCELASHPCTATGSPRSDGPARLDVMCGIAGFVESPFDRGRHVASGRERVLVHRMCDVIRHRGPDDEGMLVEPGVGARHAAAEHHRSVDRPPADSQRGSARVWIVFNGEIYNYRELRARARGARPPLLHVDATPSRSSTPTSSGATDAFARLRGMFGTRASGIARSRTLLLARDRVGIKPLYYAERERPAVFRLGDQVAARGRRDRPARSRPRRARSLPVVPLHAARRVDLRGRPQAAARAPADVAATAASTIERYWQLPARETFRGSEAEAVEPAARRAGRRRALAPGQRRAARRLPLRRRRLEPRRRR